MTEERYRMTEHGIAIREAYTTTLLSAGEAIALANWLTRHYVELWKMAGEQAKREQEQKQKETH